MEIRFELNGLPTTIDIDASVALIHVLRNDFQLHGAKLGCGLEQCGACLVLVDGEPTYACTTTMASVQNSSVLTVEGLKDANGDLDPVQEAFASLNAAQCGFCTAGVIMRIKALLLDSTRHPDDGEIREALDGHLCRCGAHPRILKAVDRAIARAHEA